MYYFHDTEVHNINKIHIDLGFMCINHRNITSIYLSQNVLREMEDRIILLGQYYMY